MMRLVAAVFISLALSAGDGFGQDLAAVFVSEGGTRVDYMAKNGGFQQRSDTTSYRFEFLVPATGNNATVRLIPIGERTSVSEEYPAVVLHRTADMVVLLLVHTATPSPDKVEIYAIYPQGGVGFSTTVSAYLGNPSMKSRSGANPKIPVASASTFPLRRIDR